MWDSSNHSKNDVEFFKPFQKEYKNFLLSFGQMYNFKLWVLLLKKYTKEFFSVFLCVTLECYIEVLHLGLHWLECYVWKKYTKKFLCVLHWSVFVKRLYAVELVVLLIFGVLCFTGGATYVRLVCFLFAGIILKWISRCWFAPHGGPWRFDVNSLCPSFLEMLVMSCVVWMYT